MTSSTIARIAANRDDALLSFADSIVEFTSAGGTIDELRTVIADAQKPAKPARKPHTRKPAPAKAATIAKGDITLDPTVGTGSAMRMTLRGVEMPTDKLVSAKRADFIAGKFTVKQIVTAAQSLGFTGKTLRTLSVADASDLLFTLKGDK